MNATEKRPTVERTELQKMFFNSSSEPDFSYANLRYACFTEEEVLCSNNFTRARLSHANFCDVKLYSVIFNHAELIGAYFIRARIDSADFSKADLYDCNFADSFLCKVNFVNADLRLVNLSRVLALDCDFSGANLTGACIENFHPNDKTKLDNITCDFVFLKGDCGFYKKYPPESKFNPGDFAKFIQYTLNPKIMATNKQAALIEAKQVILQRISQVGSIDDSQLSEELGLDLHKVRFCLDELDKLDLIKQIKAANFATDGEAHHVLRLTSKGDMVAKGELELPIDNNNSPNQTFNFNAPVYGVAGRVEGNQYIYTSEQKQTLAKAAAEIQTLLKQLEQINPTATEEEKIVYVNEETSPGFKKRTVSAFKAGVETGIEEFLDNPYVNVGKAIVKAWIKPE